MDRLLQTMAAAGVTYVSTTGIAGPLQLDTTQVRKDLEATGMVGKPKIGDFDNDPARIGLSIAVNRGLIPGPACGILPRYEHQAGCDYHLPGFGTVGRPRAFAGSAIRTFTERGSIPLSCTFVVPSGTNVGG